MPVKGVINQTNTRLDDFWQGALSTLPFLAIALAVFVMFAALGMLLGRWTKAVGRKRKWDTNLQVFYPRLVRWIVLIFGAAAALTIAVPGFTMSSVIAGLGFGSVAIGFAFRDLLENYFAGIYLLVSRPFHIGQWIKIDKVSGVVEQISTRSVYVRTFERELEILPCSFLFKNRFTVVDNAPVRRYESTLVVSLTADLQETCNLIEGVVKDMPGIADDPAPFVVAESIAENGIHLRVYYFLNTAEEGVFATRHRITRTLHDLLRPLGVLVGNINMQPLAATDVPEGSEG
ncbi:MAG: mechanosensitive ion channel [Chthonomonas sp.]|nr:mechanosensitive ion channel [Chthonomonas sp.]